MIRVGCKIHTQGPSKVDLREAARAAEDAGADSLWVEDHIVLVDERDPNYPGTADGSLDWDFRQDRLDALVACAWLAAATSRTTISTGVLVVPQRNPIELAKACASLDLLAGGRLRIGAGVGWFRAEMEAVGYDFASRGIRMNEQIEVMRGCWRGEVPAFSGKQMRVPAGVYCYPTPPRGSVPILIGGWSDAALKRAARVGDGWLAITWNDELEATELARSLKRLRQLRAGVDEAREPFEAVVLLYNRAAESFETPTRELITQLGDQASRLAELGFAEIGIDPLWRTVDDGAEIVQAVHARLA